MRNVVLVAAALMTVAWPRTAWSQVSTTPIPLVEPFTIDPGYDDLQALTRLYNAGQWTKLQSFAKSLLGAAQAAAKNTHPANVELYNALDASKHHVIVLWIGADAFGKPMLGRVIVHGPPSAVAARAEPLRADLPGVGVQDDDPVYEVFFSRGTRGRIADVYVSTRDKNPTAEELTAFVQAVAAPLFQAFGILAGPVGPTVRPAAPPSVAATVSRVALPFERATIKWKAIAREPVTESDFIASVTALAAQLKFSEIPHSTCAQDFTDALVERLISAVREPACSADATASASSCQTHIGRELAAVYDSQRCVERAEVLSIDNKVRAFVSENLTVSAETELTFRNRPLTHWSFGAGSAVITNASLTDPRVKLKDGIIVADPLPRVTTLVFVNWSPAGYSAEQEDVTLAERVRPFFGATLTPDFGIAGGVNLLLARGIGIIAGGSVMFAKGASADEIGTVPANADKAFDISYARALFLGIGYNFK